MRLRVPIILALLLAPPALGQVKSTLRYDRSMQLELRGETMVASFDCPEVFSEEVRRELLSGFKSYVVLQLQALSVDGAPVAQSFLQYTIRYDLFEQRFAVRIEGLDARRVIHVDGIEELVKILAFVRDLPLFSILGVSPAAPVRLQVRAVVNPISPELRRKVKEYMANPDGRRQIGKARSFIGGFSRIFENDLQADAVLIYWSQVLPPPRARGG